MKNHTRLIIALIILSVIGGCSTMPEKVDTAAEKAKVEEVIKNSIRWVLTKDTTLSYSCFYQDTSLFWFSPDNASNLSGFDALRQLTEQLFMDPRFKGVKSDFKDMRITLSHSGECAWWSCFLDDINEWDGKPASWLNVRWTGVLEKIEGKWKIRQMHFSHAVEDFQKKAAPPDSTKGK
jgi:hypothetical protein